VFQPDIDRISLFHVQKFVADYPHYFLLGHDNYPYDDNYWIEHDIDLTEYEISLFDKPLNNISTGTRPRNDIDDDDGLCRLLDTVAQMKGLKDRLLDASMSLEDLTEGATAGNQNKSVKGQGCLALFLKKSDAIVQELTSAVIQYWQRLQRRSVGGTATAVTGIGKRKREDESMNILTYPNLGLESSSRRLPLGYNEALYFQCNQVDQLLQQRASGQNGNRLELSDDLSMVTIRYNDENHRCHVLMGEFNPLFPSMGPIWIHDLPQTFEPKWMINNRSTCNGSAHVPTNAPPCGLSIALMEFMESISALQMFWNELDDIDENTWVLEPYLPSKRRCRERRIALCTGLSIHFTVDPENPRSVPLVMRFIGSSHDLNDLRNLYQSYISLEDVNAVSSNKCCWSESLSIRDNLERCFHLVLPSRNNGQNNNTSDFIVECGVCYSHAIPIDDDGNGSGTTLIPNITCSNSNCARCYHESCLLEWLQSSPGASTRFGRIFGQCPYCCESISVKTSKQY